MYFYLLMIKDFIIIIIIVKRKNRQKYQSVKTWVDIVNSTHLLLKKEVKTWSGG